MSCCGKCRVFRPVYGVGPRPSTAMFIGEGPGPDEDRRRVPFVGKSGRELNYQYLPMGGLSRDDVFIDNAIKCRQGKDNGDKPYPEDVAECARFHLPGTLREVNPEYVVTLGAVSLGLFGDWDLEMEHGMPIPDQYYGGWSGTVFPIYHPAAGLRVSEFMIRIQDDFRALADWRHGKVVRPVDRYPEPEYRELRTKDDFAQVLLGGWLRRAYGRGTEIGVDTETDAGRFWCLSFSPEDGTGYMIRADNHELIAAFKMFLDEVRPLLVFHNWLYDGPVLEQVGVVGYRWTDTMEMAYTLGNVSQSLKVLAYRLCGMVMQEYTDLVGPYGVAQAVEYLGMVAGMVMPEVVAALPWKQKVLRCSGGGKQWGGKHLSCPVIFEEPGDGECIICGKPKKSGKMERDKGGRQFIWDRAAAILRDVDGKGSNPVERWYGIPIEEREMIEGVIGEMPLPSITQVPDEKVIWYACRDADATRRVRRELAGRMAALGRAVRVAGS